MLRSLSVTDFRHLKSVWLESLGRITLIAGKNGAGKTALLESLWLFSGPDLPELSTRVNALRGLPLPGPDTVFKDIFRELDTEKKINITAHGDWGSRPRALTIRLRDRQQTSTIRSNNMEGSDVQRLTQPQDEGESEIVFSYKHDNGRTYVSRGWWAAEQLTVAGSVPVTGEGIRQERQIVRKRANSVFMAAVHRDDLQTTATRFGQLQLMGNDDQVLRFIRPLEPRLNRLVAITIKNTSIIHAYVDGVQRPMPVQLLGEGLNRMLSLALSMNEARGGLLLVDEIENGLHHSVQQEMFSVLSDLAQLFDVQVFATTHSDECIRAAHRALVGRAQQEFAYYRLDRINEDVRVVSFDEEMLETAIAHGMNIR